MAPYDKPHVGRLIEHRVKKLGLTNTKFASLLNCDRSDVNYIYKQPSIDLHRLVAISKILDHNFLAYYCPDCIGARQERVAKQIVLTSEEHQKFAEDKSTFVVEVRVKDINKDE